MALKWKYEKYRKLYVREEGDFAQLPLMARAIGAYLLKSCDDEGRIPTAGRSPADAIAWRCGADRSDRRLLRKLVPQLLEEGYLVDEGSRLWIRNFEPAQNGYDKNTSVPLPGIDRATNEPRSDHDDAATGQRPGNDDAANETRSRHDAATKTNPSEQNQDEAQSRARSSLPTDPPESTCASAREGALSQGEGTDSLWERGQALWDLQEELRADLHSRGIEARPMGAAPGRIKPVLQLISQGIPEQEIREAQRRYHRDAIKLGSAQHFNGSTNWKLDNIQRINARSDLSGKPAHKPAAPARKILASSYEGKAKTVTR